MLNFSEFLSDILTLILGAFVSAYELMMLCTATTFYFYSTGLLSNE